MLDWLEQHVPANRNPPVLVHGAFNIHNVLAEGGQVTGLLDWECAMFGAPEIDESSMSFYMAFSSMRLNIVFNRGVRNLQQGVTNDIRYALVELGLTPEFMKLALASTRPAAY
jgi:aminoglycoside phosphotransferase (APT) family kinase protein